MRELMIVVLLSLISVIDTCSPFGRETLMLPQTMLGVSSSGSEASLSRPSIHNNNLFPSSAVRARGENTHMAIPNGVPKQSMTLGTSSAPPIEDASELNCANFDESCRWRNIDGMFVDELDWYQGSGELDKARMAVATATNILPQGSYAIAATDSVQFPTIKAVLVSDKISCQIGDGEIRFMYWTSPEVQLKVCIKKTTKMYPDFDFCSSSIDKNDPGPVFINIPDQGPVPFQIYIIADHFTFNSDNLKGGFAILDSIEYYARMCSSEELNQFDYQHKSSSSSSESIPLIPLAESRDQEFDESSHVTSKREADQFITLSPPQFQLGVKSGIGQEKGIFDFGTEATPVEGSVFMKDSLIKLQQPTSTDNDNLINDSSSDVSTICGAIVCSFNETEPCSNMAYQSDWAISSGSVGNLLTGIRGDASNLPFNPDGSFCYTSGPQTRSRLQTPSFSVFRDVTIVFSFYKADTVSRLRVYLKKEGLDDQLIFEAPRLTRNARRWSRETISIPAGKYDYLSFEVSDLRPNYYIGIDEMFVVDDRRRSFCFN